MPFQSGITITSGPACLPAFPVATPGAFFYHTGFATMFYYNGSRWLCADGGAAIYPFGAGVVVGKAVSVIGGVLALMNVATHTYSSGLCAKIVGTDALVRWSGEVDDLAGLIPAAAYFAASTPGEITPYPPNDAAMMPLGVAHTPTRLLVLISQPVFQ